MPKEEKVPPPPKLEREKKTYANREISQLRKEKLQEKVKCDACGKTMSKHALMYTHKCKGKKGETVTTYVEPDFEQKEAEKAYERATPPEQKPDEQFFERIRQAAFAYQMLERNKHSSMIRQFYNR